MFLLTVTELFDFSSGLRVMNLDYWAKRANKKEVFGHK